MKRRILATALSLVVLLAFSTVAFAETDSYDWDVTFTSENKLESDYNTAAGTRDVFDMQPGDTVNLTLNLSNDNGKSSNWYLSNEVISSLEDSKASATGGAYEYELVYTSPSGDETVLYTSDSVGGERESDRVGLKNATEGLEDYVYLDTLEAGAKAVVRLRVSLDGETQGNDYQATLAQLQINFAVDPIVTREEVDRRTDSNVVRTGDLDESLPFLIVAGISGLLLLVLALMGMRERKGVKKSVRKVMSLLLVGALVCAVPAFSMSAYADGDEATDGSAAGTNQLTYTVRLYPGAQGTIDPEKAVSVESGAGCTLEMKDGVCVLRNVPYGATVRLNASEEDGSVQLIGTETADSKYYVRGVRESGQDNNTVGQSAFTVTGDTDYVVAYGIKGEMVDYTIRFEDEDGNELAPALTRHGNIGDKPIVAYQYIEGYRPQAYNLAKTLSENAAENVFTFTYRPIDVNVTIEMIYTPGATTVEAAPGVEPPAPGPGGEEIPEEDTPLAETPEEVIDLDETPLAPGLFDPMAELIDEFATALAELPMAVRVGMSVAIAGLGAWLILLFVRRKKDKKDAKAS